ncbi:lipocalin family protein [Myroides odoratimimus]|uniref:lipocalin family protein n=1 Tax=Myroides odoratimimus TaxID=76832 RepID=UPI0025780DB2|nr:lipocalin family protein [Myroides odoratimimus]MDM1398065.1 lipocalin family protein [Myroides odoratimimus]
MSKQEIMYSHVEDIMGGSTLACSSDDNSSTPDYKTSIQGTWKDSKTIFLDKDKKVIGEELASDNNGCGIDEREFKGDVANFKYYYKKIVGNTSECVTDEFTDKFEIKGNKISFIDEEGEIEEYEITELNKSKLVILDLEEVTESEVEGYPKGTVYIKLELVRK